jgi:hypothetical protein
VALRTSEGSLALFNLLCTKCGASKRIFGDTYEQVDFRKKICKCNYEMIRLTKGPSTSVMERLDNGVMVKPVERYSDAERVFTERHLNADPLAGTKANRS